MLNFRGNYVGDYARILEKNSFKKCQLLKIVRKTTLSRCTRLSEDYGEKAEVY